LSIGPLGAPGRPAAIGPGLPAVLDDPIVQRIANEHCKTPGQILIRFAIQRGLFVIAKTVKRERLAENGNVFDFSLTNTNMDDLLAINKNQRYFSLSFHDHKYYPFQKNYSDNI